jgi:glycosyltransferase involved in cell wall biosynthesis
MARAEGAGIAGMRITVISRCAKTLYLFRRNLVHRIGAAGAEVETLGAELDGFGTRLRAEGLSFEPIPVAMRGVAPITDLRLLISLWWRFRRRRPHVVHSFTIKPAIFGTLAASLAGVPVRVVTITGLGYAFTSAGRGLNRLVIALYRRALARAHRVYFQNADDRQLFLSMGLIDEARAHLSAGTGVDLERFVPAPLPGAVGATTFCMISRLLGEKGVREYLEAAARIRRDFPDAAFTLVGGTDTRNPTALGDAEVAALREPGGAVRWVGEVDDVRPEIARADVVVLPSYREGLPRSLLEGSAMGRAVIASDVPGCRQVVRDGISGLLVPPADAAALESAMRQLLADPARIARMGAAGREFVAGNFDELSVIRQTLAGYAELGQADRVELRGSAV